MTPEPFHLTEAHQEPHFRALAAHGNGGPAGSAMAVQWLARCFDAMVDAMGKAGSRSTLMVAG